MRLPPAVMQLDAKGGREITGKREKNKKVSCQSCGRKADGSFASRLNEKKTPSKEENNKMEARASE